MKALAPMVLFALRSLLRRPGETVLAGLALAGLTAVVATPLLASAVLEESARAALAEAPSLVVRRVGPWGFSPVPAAEGLEALRAVRGVTEAWARRVGLGATRVGPATLVGLDEQGRRRLSALGLDRPGRGEVVVGPAFAGLRPGSTLAVRGPSGRQATLRVVGAIGPSFGVVAGDLLLVCWQDSGELLGLPETAATDLAVEVFHDAEEEAIRGDIGAALPWPARLTGRAEAMRASSTELGRRSGLATIAAAPALLALLLLLVAGGRTGGASRHEAGLLRALGWSTSDLVRLGAVRALAVGLPGLCLGLGAAFAVAVWPGWGRPGDLLGLDWSGGGGAVGLETVLEVCAEVSGLVIAPWLVAALWPALRAAAADPGELLDRGAPP